MRLPLSQTFLSTITSLIKFITPWNQKIHTKFVRVERPHRDIFDKQQGTEFPTTKQGANLLVAYATTNINITYPTDRRVCGFEARSQNCEKRSLASSCLSVWPYPWCTTKARTLSVTRLQPVPESGPLGCIHPPCNQFIRKVVCEGRDRYFYISLITWATEVHWALPKVTSAYF